MRKSSGLCFSALLSIKIFILCMLFTMQTNAQNVKSVQDYQRILSKADFTKLHSVMNNLQTTVYLENGNQKTFGKGIAVYLRTDSKSLNKLKEKNSVLNNIEFLELRLTVKGEESLISIKESDLTNLTSLKYILVRSEYQLSQGEFERMFTNFKSSKINLIYEVSIPQ